MSVEQRMNQGVDRWLHFDSNESDSITLTLGSDRQWVCQVTYIHFELPDEGEWSDPSAFLFVKMNSTITVPVVLQRTAKNGGTLLPIRSPCDAPKIDAYFRGICKSTDTIQFQLLDSHYQDVPTARLIVTMHFFADFGQALVK